MKGMAAFRRFIVYSWECFVFTKEDHSKLRKWAIFFLFLLILISPSAIKFFHVNLSSWLPAIIANNESCLPEGKALVQKADTLYGIDPEMAREKTTTLQKQATETETDSSGCTLRRVGAWTFLIGAAVITALIMASVLMVGARYSDYYSISVVHFPAVVGLPMAGIAQAFCRLPRIFFV